jgi:aminoglycoside phosphotransferase (APT) family kinase protein
MHKTDITAELAARLIAAQFPQWADLPVRPVEHDGWDNTTFRLGDEMSVRLPSGDEYALAVQKEQRWLPVLAAGLPLPIPTPLAIGVPGCGYPRQWSVYRWLCGVPATFGAGRTYWSPSSAAGGMVHDLPQFAADLAGFLSALYRIDSAGGPPPGPHNWQRGGPLSYYAGEVESSLAALAGEIDTGLAAQVWAAAVDSAWAGDPVWFHGDISPGNLLVRDGRLCAVIDFGTSGVGDPACDLAIAWTVFAGQSRRRFAELLPFDQGTWARGRGWALWKAMLVLVDELDADPDDALATKHVIAEVLADHLASR